MYDLTWPKIVLLCLLALSLLLSAAMVGKPREPLSGPGLAFSIILTSFMMWLIVIS